MKSLLGKISKDTLIILGVIIVLLVAFRIALPFIVLDYVNKTIDELPGYTGKVADVDISLWRGAYQIDSVAIFKVQGNKQVPFFSAAKIDLSVQWDALFDGSLVGELVFFSPKINFIEGPTEAQSQTEVDKSWQDKVKELFPLKINRFEIKDGEIHFMAPHKKPKVDIYAQNINALAENLTNSQDLSETLVATLKATGNVMKGGAFTINTKIDPFAKQPTFDLDAKLTKVKLTQLNNFIKAYGDFDVEGGTFEMTAEFAAKEGKFTGYVKPFFKDMKVFSFKEKHDNVFQAVWEAIVSTVTELFENQEKEHIATKLEFSGSFKDPDMDIWRAIGGVLRNAFIQAFIPNIEKSVEIRNIDEKEK